MVQQPVVHLRPSLRVERQRVGSVRLRQLRSPPVTLKPTLHAIVSVNFKRLKTLNAACRAQSSHCTAGMAVSASAWLVDITGPDWLTGCVCHWSSVQAECYCCDASSAHDITYFDMYTRCARTVVTRSLVSHLHLQGRRSASKRAQVARPAFSQPHASRASSL